MALVIKRGVRANGRTYLPGEEAALAAFLSPYQIESLKQRGAIEDDGSEPFVGDVADTAAPSPEELKEDDNGLSDEGDEVVAEANDDLSILDEIGTDIAQLLADAGFDTAEKIRAATDAELNALPKIGPATVAKIRAALEGL